MRENTEEQQNETAAEREPPHHAHRRSPRKAKWATLGTVEAVHYDYVGRGHYVPDTENKVIYL